MYRDLRSIMLLVVPLFFEQLFNTLLGTVNAMVAGNISQEAVAAISFVDSFNLLLTAFFIAVATGATVVVSQYFGRNDHEKAELAAGQAIFSMTVVGIVLMLPLLLFSRQIILLTMPSADPVVAHDAIIYLRFSALALPFFGLNAGTAGVLRGAGDSRTSMSIAFILNLVNIVCSLGFVRLLHWDIYGLGAALLTARVVSAIASFYIITHRQAHICLKRIPLKPDLPVLKTIYKIGLPISVESILFQGGKFLNQTVLATLGTVQMTAFNIGFSLCNLRVVPAGAISIATSAIIGATLGENDKERAKKLLRQILFADMALNLVVVLASAPFIHLLPGLYNADGETAQIVIKSLHMLGIFQIISYSGSFALPNGLKAAGDVKTTTMISLMTTALMRVGLSCILATRFGMGAYGMQIGMAADWTLRFLLFGIRTARGKWVDKKVI